MFKKTREVEDILKSVIIDETALFVEGDAKEAEL